MNESQLKKEVESNFDSANNWGHFKFEVAQIRGILILLGGSSMLFRKKRWGRKSKQK